MLLANTKDGETMTMQRLLCLSLVMLMLTPSAFTIMDAAASPTDGPTPPDQPADGPGGSNYTHAAVTEHQYGLGSWSFWLFEPAEPTPTSAPVIVFNHGYGAVTPQYYQAWITHLVRRGNIVIYPRYQLGMIIGVHYATLHAIWAVHHALVILKTTGHVRPDLDKFAIVGHSLGGGITADMARQAAAYHLPAPKAIMPVQP
jgi:acetyl esterase/lipase